MQTLDISKLNINSEALSFSEIRNLMNKSSNKDFIGSDEHLDFINQINNYLDIYINQISQINEFVDENFPQDVEFAKSLSKNLVQLYGGLNIGLSMLKTNDATYSSHESRIVSLKEEVDQIQEYILDIEKFILNKSDEVNELDNLLKSM